MKIIADANISGLDLSFGRHGEVVAMDGRKIRPADVGDADALIVRSVTPVNQILLENSSVQFVGSCTIGIDHLDTQWLDHAGIAWSAAPGCNADAAAQYTLAMILLSCLRLEREFEEQTVGIFGLGNVGSRLKKLLDALNVRSVACDPLLEDAGQDGLVSHQLALENTIISLHIPLTTEGPYPTRSMVDESWLAMIPDGALLVNAARGDVIREAHLLKWLRGNNGFAALDTWPGEPDINLELLAATTVASPHIAGYSQDGKRRGSEMIYAAFCRHFSLDAISWPPLPAAGIKVRKIPQQPGAVTQIILSVCDVLTDDTAMRGLLHGPTDERGKQFDALRHNYPARREFGQTRPDDVSFADIPELTALGFIP